VAAAGKSDRKTVGAHCFKRHVPLTKIFHPLNGNKREDYVYHLLAQDTPVLEMVNIFKDTP
jgi:hypothetical protein